MTAIALTRPREATPAASISFAIAASLTFVAVWIAASGSLEGLVFPLDDAAITMANARALVAGVDPANPGVSPFVGATSLSHLLLTAGLHAVIREVHLAAAGAAFVSLAFYLFALDRLVIALGASGVRRIAMIACGLLGFHMPFQLHNGLETVLAAGCVAFVMGSVALWRDGEVRIDGPTAAVVGLAILTRPEFLALPPVLGGTFLWTLWRQGRLDRHALSPSVLKLGMGCALALATMLVLTGHALPSTAGAKAAFFSVQPDPAASAQILAVSLVYSGFFLAVWGAMRSGSPAGLFGGALAVVVIAALFAAWPQLLVFNHGRYIAFLAPFAVFAMFVVESRRLALAVVPVLMAGSLVFVESYRAALESHSATWRASSAWLRNATPKDAVVIVHDVGFVTLEGERRLIDAVGLKTPWVTRFHETITKPSRGRDLATAYAAIAERGRPTYMLVMDGEEAFEPWRQLPIGLARAARIEKVMSFPCSARMARFTFCMSAYRIDWQGR